MHCRRKLHELPGIDLSNSRDEMIEYIVHTIHELVSEECPICAMERVLGVKEKEEEDVRLEYNQFFRNPKEKRLNL